VSWRSSATLYGDNSEFFNPYREGETILGGQFTSALVVKPAAKYAVHAGVFGDVRWGSTEFLDQVKPVLSFRYSTPTSLAVLGTLETVRRHGLLDPLAVSTLELTRPVEYGLQWIERRSTWDLDTFINWQAVNTSEQREMFDYGAVVRIRPIRQAVVEGQFHWVHRGGQLSNGGGVPVANNVTRALGVTLSERIRGLGSGSVAAFRLWSSGVFDPDPAAHRPDRGHGTLVRLGLSPGAGLEVFGVRWWGRDFLSQEGDRHYNSAGLNPGFYRSRRKYVELGIARRGRLEGGVELDAEFRFHRIDTESSIAIRGIDWEYSYRLVVRAPVEFVLR
jgi:hypothetical protein